MSVVRAVTFEGVSAERVANLVSRMESGERPEDVPVTEMMMLHDEANDRALVLQFFADDADYARGEAVFAAMPADETPGTRASVDRYTLAVRATA
jgi:hypothetical protein